MYKFESFYKFYIRENFRNNVGNNFRHSMGFIFIINTMKINHLFIASE